MSTTLAKGLKLLEVLCQAREAIGITELAKSSDLNLSAVQRLLKTLVSLGYVSQDKSSRKYQATLMAWEIGCQQLRDHPFYRAIHPILRQAAQSTGYTALFIQNNTPFVTYFDKVEGPRGATYSSQLGSSIPIGITAAGLAIVAFLEPEARANLTLPATRGTVEFSGLDLGRLEEAIATIRERRYATSVSGFRKGVNSVAAPVWGPDDSVCGAIALTADEHELKMEDFPEIGQKVVRWSLMASTSLGGSPYPQTFYTQSR